MTLVEIAEMLKSEFGASFAPNSIWRFLDRHGITFKKSARAAEQDRPDVAAARQAWRELAPQLDPDKLVFIDETGALTKMGAALRPLKTRPTMPRRGPAWSLADYDFYRCLALHRPDCADDPRRTDERRRLPRLCRTGVGTYSQSRRHVVMDNLPAHKGAAVRAAIEASGASLLLLPAILARLQSDRERLCQIQIEPAQSRRQDRRHPPSRNRRRLPSIHP